MQNRSDHIRSFALRQGRTSKGQKRALDELSASYCISRDAGLLDLDTVFEGKDVVLEIGFGMGMATAEIAKLFPHLGFLGIEVYPAGVGKLLAEIEKDSIGNIRIVREDAVDVVEQMIPDASISGVHIFFPDPWPKTRHHKRRLVKRDFLRALQTKLKSQGYLYIVTDWVDYAEWILEELRHVDGFVNEHGSYSPPLQWRPKTKFEQKGLEKGHEIREIFVTKV